MSEYTLAGKTRLEIATVDKKQKADYYEFYFANEHKDKNFVITDKNFTGATFVDLGFKEAVIKNVNFSYCTFVDCYFRGARFDNCNFTGAKFQDCNFRRATIVSCDFSYSGWRGTIIDRLAVLSNLPTFDNLAQDLLINMRINANSIGEYDDARKYVYESEKRSRRHNWKKFSGAYAPYKLYSLDARIAALFRYLRSHAERIFWGYGERIWNLGLTTIFIIVAFGLLYFLKQQTYFINAGHGVTGGLVESTKLSFSVFTSFNLIQLDNSIKSSLYNWFLVEAPLGIVFIGFLAASLHRKISMRRD